MFPPTHTPLFIRPIDALLCDVPPLPLLLLLLVYACVSPMVAVDRYFIDHTIRAEQQDYETEGVEWEHVNYFNNKVCVVSVFFVLDFTDEQ